MELRQLRYFVAVAQELHFGRAARRIRVSQPPLSRQISALEKELGVKLLDRTRHHVELTAAGTALYAEAREILAAIERAKAIARSASPEPSGPLRIGFVPAIGWPLKSRLIQDVVARYPKIAPRFVPDTSAEQVRAIRAYGLDVGVIWEPARRRGLGVDLERLVLREDQMALSVALNHRFARRRSVPVELLAGETLIVSHRNENPVAHDAILGAIKRTRMEPNLLYTDGSGILDLIAAGVGVGFISPASPHVARTNIVVRNFTTPVLLVRLVMVWLADNGLPALRGFLEVTKELHQANQLF